MGVVGSRGQCCCAVAPQRARHAASRGAAPARCECRAVCLQERFQKFRGLKSFRTSQWDPKEDLPPEYAKVFAFENFTRAKKIALATRKAAVQVRPSHLPPPSHTPACHSWSCLLCRACCVSGCPRAQLPKSSAARVTGMDCPSTQTTPGCGRSDPPRKHAPRLLVPSAEIPGEPSCVATELLCVAFALHLTPPPGPRTSGCSAAASPAPPARGTRHSAPQPLHAGHRAGARHAWHVRPHRAGGRAGGRRRRRVRPRERAPTRHLPAARRDGPRQAREQAVRGQHGGEAARGVRGADREQGGGHRRDGPAQLPRAACALHERLQRGQVQAREVHARGPDVCDERVCADRVPTAAGAHREAGATAPVPVPPHVRRYRMYLAARPPVSPRLLCCKRVEAPASRAGNLFSLTRARAPTCVEPTSLAVCGNEIHAQSDVNARFSCRGCVHDGDA